MSRFVTESKEFLESIKFSHSIFALPFAIIALLLARRGTLPTWREALWIILAMIGARTWAMGVNRLVDARIDAQNPRTAARAVPQGRITSSRMLQYSLLGAALFVLAAFELSFIAGLCSVPVLLILGSYSYTKRFTFLCHFWLGLCLGLAPLGAWVALTGNVSTDMFILTLAILFWVAGFDILYALQDEQFDRDRGYFSIPARFGTDHAIRLAQIAHIISACLFLRFGLVFNLGTIYFIGIACATGLMIYEHILVMRSGLKHINIAFFNLNGWVAVTLLFATSLNLLLE